MDYDTTKESGANKTYTSKINVIANHDIEVTQTPEIKTALINNTLEGTINGTSSTAQYCISEENICEPNINTPITDNKINIEIERKTKRVATTLGNIEVNTGSKRTICTKIDNEKIYCSNIISENEEPDFSKIATTDEGIYSKEDGMYGGTSYYWRGAATTNYLKFGGFCWRIVRINGDGSIRLIYDGTTCHANGEVTTDSIAVSNVAYNANYGSSPYVGWTHVEGKQRPEEGDIVIDSNAKTKTEEWYNNNIGNNETNDSKVVNGKYCNDRNTGAVPSTLGGTWSTSWSATGTQFAYAALDRMLYKYQPTLACNAGDVYTLKTGLITADEVEMAGGKNGNNTSYYLYNGQNHWTMTPIYWYNSSVWVFIIYSSDCLSNTFLGWTDPGLRPVINLRSDITISSGNGTLNNPYIVE